MALSPLAGRLAQLPLILAGPILRRVTPDAVTVWVALQQSATVTLTVYDSNQSPVVGSTPASRQTFGIGKNLHIVAVTLRAPAAFSEGHIYLYDLTFTTGSGTLNLSQAVTAPGKPLVQNPFAYAPHKLPSFALPPKDLTKLRLIHGSCRKPHGEGFDALPILGDLISEKANDAYARPHQLILSGDQVYTDDVGDALLLMLTDAGDALLGWAEAIPVGLITMRAAQLPPYTREDPLKNYGFTSDDRRSQLMSLGEYFAMYLFAWSDVPWPDPKTPLATFAEILAVTCPGVDPTGAGTFIQQQDYYQDLASPIARTMLNRRGVIEFDTANLETFRRTLPDVRKVLANIPSYMICDDHEITDDWNMHRRFCEKVYGGSLGLRVIQNGLTAFAICQVWGNVPEQFADYTPNPPGLQLLNTLQSISALAKDDAPTAYGNQQNTARLMTIVGVHTDAQLKATAATTKDDYRVYLERGASLTINGVPLNDTSLRYNFSIEGPGHQVIVTDSRNWRSFPGGSPNQHPDLIWSGALRSQFDLDVPPLLKRQLFVVVTTNIPPIAGVRKAEAILDKMASQLDAHDLHDSWEFDSGSYDNLIAYLDKKLTAASQSAAPVIFLSGDVHFSFSSRLAYWADHAQYGDSKGQETTGKRVFAQLVASALKNEIEDTRGEQDVGYTYTPHLYTDLIAPNHEPEYYCGWNVTAEQQVGNYGSYGAAQNGVREGSPVYVSPDKPKCKVYVWGSGKETQGTLDIPPDYRYRLDYLTTTSNGQTAPAPVSISPVSSTTEASAAAKARARSAQAYVTAIQTNTRFPDCIGRNNIGEIRLSVNVASGIVDHVYHTLRWQQLGPPTDTNSRELVVFAAAYDVTADIEDANYKFPAKVSA